MTDVVVLDDNQDIIEALRSLLGSVHINTVGFTSPLLCLEYLIQQHANSRIPHCIICDIRMPEMDGLAFQDALSTHALPIPIIFLSAFVDVPQSVLAIKSGAVNVLLKPFRENDLLPVVQDLVRNGRGDSEHNANERLSEYRSKLTPKQQQVFDGVAQGLSAKETAAILKLSPRTVEIHRGNILNRLGLSSIAELRKLILRRK